MNNNTIKSSDFVKKSMSEFGVYTCYHRAIPDFRDGLIPSQRRVIYTYDKHVGSGSIKVAELAGRALAYHPHGDASTAGVINELSRSWAGANNYRVFIPDGAVGSIVFSEKKRIASPRYLSVKSDPFLYDVVLEGKKFIKYTLNYDQTKEEPEYYTPVIPLSMLNGCSNIAYGFSTDILPRMMETIIPLIKGILSGDKSVLSKVPNPSWVNFKGDVVKNGNNRWITHMGIISHSSRKHSIVDLPVGMSREYAMNYIDDSGIKYSNDSTDVYNITCYCQKNKLPSFTKTFNERIVVYKDGGLKEYPTILHYLLEFVRWRKDVFTSQIKMEIASIDEKLFSLTSKYKFITKGYMEKIADEVTKRDYPKEEMENFVKEANLCLSVLGTRVDETTDRAVANLLERIKDLKQQRAVWNKKSGKSLYLEKISALEKKYCV